MRNRALRGLLLLGGIAALPGCGSVQEVIVDTVRTATKEAIEEAVDDTVDGLLDDLTAGLPDFEDLMDEEGSLPEDDGELPNE